MFTRSTTRCAAAIGLVGAAALLASCESGGGGGDGAVELRFGHLYETSHPFHECGAQPFAEKINGAGIGLNVTVYPAAQLGNEQELAQSVAAGDLDLGVAGPGGVANWYSPIGVLDAAYVVDDWGHMRTVWDGEIGDSFRDGLSAEGINPVDLWLYGTRHVTTADTSVTSPDDLAGLKLRAIDTPVSLANAEAIGASPVPIAFDELYVALSQGVVDGQENPIPTIDSLELSEVQGYLNLTGHLLQSSVILESTATMDKLNDEQQEAVEAGLQEVGEDVRECVETIEDERVAEWESEGAWDGIVYPEDMDLDTFRDRAAEQLPAQFGDEWDGLYEQIRDLAE